MISLSLNNGLSIQSKLAKIDRLVQEFLCYPLHVVFQIIYDNFAGIEVRFHINADGILHVTDDFY